MIGELREGPLHRELKTMLAGPGDEFEVRVDGYVIDLVRADGELVEVQTGGFSPLRAKLDALLDRHRMRIVHPIPARRRIVRVDEDGEVLSERPSPKKPGRGDDLRGPGLLPHPALAPEPRDRGPALPRGPHPQARAGPRPALPARPGRAAPDRGPRAHRAQGPADAAALIPAFEEPFTTKELAKAMRVPLPLAQKTAACLRALEVFEPAGMRGRAPLYTRV